MRWRNSRMTRARRLGAILAAILVTALGSLAFVVAARSSGPPGADRFTAAEDGRAAREAAEMGLPTEPATPAPVGSGADREAAGTDATKAEDTGRKTTTPIEHFFFLMQENHTFDNYFGTRPGVDGIPPGTCMPRKRGQAEPCVKPFHMGELGSLDLDHTEQAFRTQYNGGKMDGFIEGVSTQGKDGKLAMAHYDDRDLPYYWNLADEYVLFDRLFSSANSGSIRNHMFRVTGGPGATGKAEAIPPDGWGDIPTIFDRLEAAGISWKFYVENYDPSINFRTRAAAKDIDKGAQAIWVPLLSYGRYVDNPKLFGKIQDLDNYYDDAANGTLPAVAFIAPAGDSEHPPGNVRAGQTLIRSLLTQLMRSSAWDSSAFFWSYDDWGGWYDHVKPPQVDKYGYGFRVPALLVSSYAKRGHVDHTTLDFTSALKFIEVNWRLKSLAERDRKAKTFMSAFDFTKPPRPPTLLSTERNPPAPVQLRVSAVYTSYGVAATVAILLFLGAAVRFRRVAPAPGRPRSRTRKTPRGDEP